MAMRNPAVYLDRIQSGQNETTVSRDEQWQTVARQTDAIIEAHHAFAGTRRRGSTLNSLHEIQSLAYVGTLEGRLGQLVASQLLSSSDIFGKSIEAFPGADVSYHYHNARAAQTMGRRESA